MNIMSFDFNGTDAKQILYSHTSYGHLHSIIMECNHSYSFTYQFFFFLSTLILPILVTGTAFN